MAYVGSITKRKAVSAYDQYGDAAARVLMQQVAILPASHRASNLKAVMTKIDPSLWNRTVTIANRYKAQGAAPGVALQKGMSRAMATGLAAEVVKLGQKGGAVPKKGLLGLGTYGRSAVLKPSLLQRLGLGAIPTGALTSSSTTTTANANGPTQGQCDATGAMIFDSGAWRRLKVGETCAGNSGVVVASGTVGGGVTVTNADGTTQTAGAGLSQAAPANTLQMMQVGPFAVPLGAELTIHWTGLLPDDWRAFIAAELAQDCKNCVITSMEASTAGHPLGALIDFIGDLTPAMSNKDLVSIGPAYKTVGSINPSATSQQDQSQLVPLYNWPDQPVAQCQRPDNGEVWGFYMNIIQADITKPWDSTTNPYVCVLRWRKAPTGVWDFIKMLVGTLIDWVGDALDALGDLACGLLANPIGGAGAVVAGAAVGASQAGTKGAQAGAQVGAAGAAIANAACNPTPACPVGTTGIYPQCVPVPTTPDWLMPVAIGGLGLLAILAMTGKKKKKKPGAAPTPAPKTTKVTP